MKPWGWKGHKHLTQFSLICEKKVKKEVYRFQILHLVLFLKGNYCLFSFFPYFVFEVFFFLKNISIVSV